MILQEGGEGKGKGKREIAAAVLAIVPVSGIIAGVRTLVTGDIHGNLRALKQAFGRAGFDPGRDRLVVLGDVFDGHPYSAECVEELMRVKDLIWCIGNHDVLALSWLRDEPGRGEWKREDITSVKWSYNGGKTKADRKRMKKHADFAASAATLYHVDEAGRLYVHAGIDWAYPVNRQPDPEIYYTDRSTYAVHAVVHMLRGTKFPYADVYVGHTKTINEYPDGMPVRRANLWNLDTGAGTYGKLTVMDADTYEFWQSDRGERA